MNRGLALVLAAVAAAALAGPVAAAPRPGLTPGAITITMDCDGTTLDLVTIEHNAAAAGQTDEGVAHLVAAWGYSNPERTENEVFFYGTPGYDHNGHELLVCDFENPAQPGIYVRALVELRP